MTEFAIHKIWRETKTATACQLFLSDLKRLKMQLLLKNSFRRELQLFSLNQITYSFDSFDEIFSSLNLIKQIKTG